MFEEIVEKYKDKVFNICWSFVKNMEDAEDVAQEVFVEVFMSIHKFRGDANLYTWICRIAVNKSLDMIRKNKRQSLMKKAFLINKPLEPSFEHPGLTLENEDKAQAVSYALSKLSKDQRIAFTLHVLQDFSYKEISNIMQKTIPSVESLIFRARKKSKKLLKQYYEKSKF